MLEAEVKLSLGRAVDSHLVVGQQTLDGCAFALGHGRDEKLE